MAVDEATVRKLVNVALEYLPDSVPLPRLEQEIFSCPFSTAANVALVDTDLEADILSHTVELEADALRVTARVNLLVEGGVEATLCDIPAASCELLSTVRPALVSGRVRPALDACELRAEFEDVSIEVDSDDVVIELSDCAAIEPVADLVLWGFQSLILDAVVPFLETYIIEDVPQLIQAAGIGAVLPSFSAFGVDVEVAPDALRFDENTVHVTARAWAEPEGLPAKCVPAGSNFSVDVDTPPPMMVSLGNNEGARLGASQDFLQQLVLAAWGTGLLCFDLAALGLDLEELLEPIFPEVTLRTEVRSAAAPVVQLTRSGAGDLILDAPSVEADVFMALPGDAPATARVRTGARIAGRVVIDPASTSVAIEPIDLDILPTEIELPTRTLSLRPEGLKQLYDDTLVPLLFGESGRLTVLDSVFSGAPLALELVEIDTKEGLLQAGLRVWEKPPDDRIPPLTVVSAALGGPTQSDVAIVANSTDDQTPSPLMRHRVIVDGIPQSPFRVGQRFRVQGLLSGWRRLEVQAVDLNDNLGAPVEVEVLVDTDPPRIEVVEGPLGVAPSTTVIWRLTAVDDLSPPERLTTRYALEAWTDDHGQRETLDEGSLSLDTPLTLEGLPEDQLLSLHFFVEDEAGNEAQVSRTFSVDTSPTIGCRSTSGSSLGSLVVLGFGLLALRRRHRARG
ncbi:MAG: hypothetical protein AAFZ18_16035 [Myxococcota bacterium]